MTEVSAAREATVPRYLRNRPCLQEINDNNIDAGRNNSSNGRRHRVDLLNIDVNEVNDGYSQRSYNRQRDCIETTTTMMTNGNNDNGKDNTHEFQFGDTTYRHDGFSIGKDYLRCNGKTITKGKLLSNSLSVGKLLGEGNFSKVHKGMWTTTSTTSITKSAKKKKELNNKIIIQDENINNCNITNPGDVDDNDNDNDDCIETQNTDTIIPVAVKQCSVLDISDQRKKMLIKELRTLCQLQSEALVGFHGAFLHDDDAVVLVMEYMDVGSLEQWRKNKSKSLQPSRMEEAFFASIAYQVITGLEYLHSQRILHRDIKPGNILLNTNGAVKLCDFGIVSLYGEDDHSLQTTVVGTSRFMSPERLRAKPYGKASDIWSFGLVMLELWNGVIPFQDCEYIVSLVISVEETPLDELVSSDSIQSTNLRDVLLGCLQQSPKKRMPASVLRQAPWFTFQHKITTIENARTLLQENNQS
jgi:serine/threonine protein kinase